MINKKKVVTIIAVTLIVGALFVSVPAYAADSGFKGGNFFSGLVEFISQKLGIDKTKVQSAVQEYQQQKKATITPRPTMSSQQQQDAEKKRLDLLVSQGKITQDQENAIITELKAMMAKYPFDKNATQDQRKTQITNMQNELKAWLQSPQGQEIDQTYVLPMLRRGGVGGRMNGNFRGRGPKPTPTP